MITIPAELIANDPEPCNWNRNRHRYISSRLASIFREMLAVLSLVARVTKYAEIWYFKLENAEFPSRMRSKLN